MRLGALKILRAPNSKEHLHQIQSGLDVINHFIIPHEKKATLMTSQQHVAQCL